MTQINENTTEERLVIEYDAGGQKVKLSQKIVKDFLTNGQDISLPEYKMFTELCKARRLNPFLREAYIIKYGDSPAQIVVSKDVFLQRANNNVNYDGKENGVITEDKETKEIKHRNGSFCPLNETIVGGWCKVYRKDRKYPEYVSVSTEECAKKKSDGKLTSNWIYQKGTMIEKVAVSRALRNAFPEEFSGMYIEEEMSQSQEIKATDPLDSKPEVIDVEVETKEVDINSL